MYINNPGPVSSCIIVLLLLASMQAFTQSSPYGLILRYENDAFVKTDRYYTQGILLEYSSPIFSALPDPFQKLFRGERRVIKSFSLQQEGYTPSTILDTAVPYGDRPYCGSLFAAYHSYAYYPALQASFKSSLMLGVIGPAALGYEEQTAIHRITGDPLPKGWRYEIRNDLVLNLALSLNKSVLYTKLFDICAEGKLRAGTLFTDLGGIVHARFGIRGKWFEPANIPKWQLYAGAGLGFRLIAYNASLQGGMLNRSSVYRIPANDIQRLLYEQRISLHAAYATYRFSVHKTVLSKEFRTGQEHNWGGFQLGIGF